MRCPGANTRFPKTLIEFQGRFASEGACAGYLFERRWPTGICLPCMRRRTGVAAADQAYTYECAGCGRQTSVTAGTIM